MSRRIVAVLSLVLVTVVTSTAAASDRRGVQRQYAGAAWGDTNDILGWNATLTLDRARVRDGGYIAQTMWATTNGAKTRYGKNKKAPYVQVGVSSGYKGQSGNFIVMAGRDTKGRYFEGQSPGPAVQLGKPYKFSLTSEVGTAADDGNQWSIGNGGELIGTFGTTGDDPYSHSVYGGLESSSTKNSAAGEVTETYRTITQGKAVAPFPCWQAHTGSDVGAEIVRRGPGAKASWTRRQCSLRNAYGR